MRDRAAMGEGRGSKTILRMGLIVGLLSGSVAAAQLIPGAVGLRATVSNVDPGLRSVDLDLTAYTRYSFGPYGYLGLPTYGLPAIDWGDGSSVPSTTLALTSIGGGPGGSNVYRSLASFSHTYPSLGSYTVRAAMYCAYCLRLQYVSFPAGSPPPPTFTTTLNFLPATLIGNLALPYAYSGTYYSSYLSTSVRLAVTYYLAVTNTAAVNLASVLEIPTLSQWGMILMGVALFLTGLILIRRL